MSQENVEVVGADFEAFDRGDSCRVGVSPGSEPGPNGLHLVRKFGHSLALPRISVPESGMHVSMPEIQAFEVASRTNGRDPSRSAKRCRRVRLPVVVATILIGLVWCPAALARNPKAIWGPVHMPDGSSALPVYRELGVRFLQLGLSWSSIAPTRPSDPTDPNDPSYRWPPDVDTALRRAGRYGLRIALLANSSPSWPTAAVPPYGRPATPITPTS
jgi:hypothetical protein